MVPAYDRLFDHGGPGNFRSGVAGRGSRLDCVTTPCSGGGLFAGRKHGRKISKAFDQLCLAIEPGYGRTTLNSRFNG
jgi:hypothetical protein